MKRSSQATGLSMGLNSQACHEKQTRRQRGCNTIMQKEWWRHHSSELSTEVEAGSQMPSLLFPTRGTVRCTSKVLTHFK